LKIETARTHATTLTQGPGQEQRLITLLMLAAEWLWQTNSSVESAVIRT